MTAVSLAPFRRQIGLYAAALPTGAARHPPALMIPTSVKTPDEATWVPPTLLPARSRSSTTRRSSASTTCDSSGIASSSPPGRRH